MKIRCIAIDDEPWALNVIQEYAKKIPDLELVACFEDAIAGSEFLRKYNVDLLFLDINMPDMNGLTLAYSLTDNKPLIVFTTAYRKFAYEGFELEAIDYLLKPFDLDRFKKAVDKTEKALVSQQFSRKNNEDSIFVWSEHQQIKILLSEIMYIESKKDYTCFHLEGKPKLLTLLPLKRTEEILPAEKFLRIHRSFIVPITGIKKIISKKIVLNNLEELPIGRLYADNINRIVKK